MNHVLTLIADPAAADLGDSLVADARAALNALGARTGNPDWLAPGVACDIPFDDLDCDQAAAAVNTALPDAAVDRIAQPQEGRRKRLLIADMESTIIRQEMLDELADLV
jgi:phosphoserine phosphatase